MMVAVASLAWMSVGCSSGPEEQDPSTEEVVGSPPDEDSPDYEFALPETSVDASSQSGDDAVVGYPDTEAVQLEQIDRLKAYGPSVVMEHVQLEPVHDDGFVGFEIRDISPTARPYLEAELGEGDVITHVNLVRLEQPDDYMEAWDALSETEEIRVDFERDGESRAATWEVE